MTVKETLIQAYRDHGYDCMTACEYATKDIARLKTLPAGTHDIVVSAPRRDWMKTIYETVITVGVAS